MAPMSRYGTPGAGPAAAAREFKTMVKARQRHTRASVPRHPRLFAYACMLMRVAACVCVCARAQELHRAGIEVILDVVYNHTAEVRAPLTQQHAHLDVHSALR
jgi:hypothetical protein